MSNVKSILISQPEPKTENSPYFDLAKKKNIQIDFKPFIQVESLDATEFRTQKLDLQTFNCIIFTSRVAVDSYFEMLENLRVDIDDDNKYFCQTEAIAVYLQKFITYRKRKVLIAADMTFGSLTKLFEKHKDGKYLIPTSDVLKPEVPKLLDASKVDYTRAIMFRTVSSDLSDLEEVKYDVLAFFSPSGIKSLFENFPDFTQNKTCIAAFGQNTVNAVKDAGLRCDIEAPTSKFKSMTMALESYIEEQS